ncbi:MAG: P63C domain-containing protein [Gemmataceae bacterium]
MSNDDEPPAPEQPKTDSPQRNAADAARTLSSLGASKGGHARANVLSEEERKEIAKKAIRARWEKAGKQPKTAPLDSSAGDSGPDPEPAPPNTEPGQPYSMLRGTLTIGNIELECHVLNNHQRVMTQREVVRIISGGRESGNLARYLERNPLTATDFNPAVIHFTVPPGTVASGYDATVLVEICDRYLQAREQKLLKKSQFALAKQAEIVLRSCAKVGIIALIDEATGFEKMRRKRALQLKLQAFIAEEMQEWARMFKDEFWLELARLEGIHYSPRSRPLRWGKYIMMFVYDAVDGEVGKELRKRNPNPHFLKNHHQWLKKFGREKVHDQIERVIVIMKLCNNMADFRAKFAKVFKKTPLQLTFDDLDWQQDE